MRRSFPALWFRPKSWSKGRGPKIIIFKKRRRQNYRRKRGHRQDLTTVRILEIFTDGRAPVAAKREAPVTEEAVPVAPLKVHAENAASGSGSRGRCTRSAICGQRGNKAGN